MDIKFNMQQVSPRSWECAIGRFSNKCFHDLLGKNLLGKRASDEINMDVRLLLGKGMRCCESRVEVKLKEEKGKMTKVFFSCRPEFAYHDEDVPEKKKMELFIATSLIYKVTWNGQIKHFAPAWAINKKLAEYSAYCIERKVKNHRPYVAIESNLTREEIMEYLLKIINLATKDEK